MSETTESKRLQHARREYNRTLEAVGRAEDAHDTAKQQLVDALVKAAGLRIGESVVQPSGIRKGSEYLLSRIELAGGSLGSTYGRKKTKTGWRKDDHWIGWAGDLKEVRRIAAADRQEETGR